MGVLVIDNDLKFIEDNIKNLLKRQHKDVKTMCGDTGISEQRLYGNFRKRNYQTDTLATIATYLDVPLAELVRNPYALNTPVTKVSEPGALSTKRFNEKQRAKFAHLMSTIDQAAEKIKNDIIRFIE